VTDRFTKLSRCITYAIAHVSGCLDDRFCERHGLNILTVFAARGATLPPRVNAATIPLRMSRDNRTGMLPASVDASVQGVRVLEKRFLTLSPVQEFQVL
jgi:hypothetical protein